MSPEVALLLLAATYVLDLLARLFRVRGWAS